MVTKNKRVVPRGIGESAWVQGGSVPAGQAEQVFDNRTSALLLIVLGTRAKGANATVRIVASDTEHPLEDVPLPPGSARMWAISVDGGNQLEIAGGDAGVDWTVLSIAPH
jgi:hypothetical protein